MRMRQFKRQLVKARLVTLNIFLNIQYHSFLRLPDSNEIISNSANENGS